MHLSTDPHESPRKAVVWYPSWPMRQNAGVFVFCIDMKHRGKDGQLVTIKKQRDIPSGLSPMLYVVKLTILIIMVAFAGFCFLGLLKFPQKGR